MTDPNYYVKHDWEQGEIITEESLDNLEDTAINGGNSILIQNTKPDNDTIGNKIWINPAEENRVRAEIITLDDLNSIIAPLYSNQNTYKVNEYVITNTNNVINLWRCKTPITKKEAWNAAHWAPVQIGKQYENFVIVNNNEPTEAIGNKIWIQPQSSEYQIPTWEEFTALQNAFLANKDLTDSINENNNIEEIITQPWAVGSISSTTGKGITSTTRIRTTYIPISQYHTIKVNLTDTNYSYIIDWYAFNSNDSTYTLLSEYSDGNVWRNESKIFTTFPEASALRILIRKNDNSTLTLDNLSMYLSNFEFIGSKKNEFIFINNINNNLTNKINNNNRSLKELYIGNFVQGSLQDGGGLKSDDNTRITQETRGIAFPGKYEYHIHMTPGYKVRFQVGIDPTTLKVSTGWLHNGDIMTWENGGVLPQYARFYRASIAQDLEDALVSPERLSNIDLHIWYEDDGYNIVTGNSNAWSKAKNNMRTYGNSTVYFIQKNFPIIAHTSDIHADYVRTKNFFDFCDAFGVDAACVTGDIVGYHITNHCDWFHNIVNTHKSVPAVCVGNHDAYTNITGYDLTDTIVYNYLLDPISDKLGLNIAKMVNGTDLNTSCPTNYIKDLDDQQIRIISYNLYAYGGISGRSRWHTHYTAEYINWLINALKSTPEGYGVILLAHAPQYPIEKDNNYDTFWQTIGRSTSSIASHNEYVKDAVSNGNPASPLNDIIDAFISRSQINKMYYQFSTTSGTPHPDNALLQVAADFTSGVANNVEFIAFLGGHLHRDSIGYTPNTTNLQLQLNITCGTAVDGTTDGTNDYYAYANLSDQARSENGFTQDAFNLYIIDRNQKIIKVVRVGSNSNFENQSREYMEIPYA